MQLTAKADKSRLLQNLAIDRGQVQAPTKPRGKLLIVCLAALVIAGAGYLYTSQSGAAVARPVDPLIDRLAPAGDAPPLPVTLVETAPTPDVQQPVLEAPGYVVARQAATVSSTTTGKVSEVLIEEGMAVQRGQIMARLDDSKLQAALDLASAELGATIAARRELLAQVKAARLNFDRSVALAGKSLVSQASVDALRAELDTLLARSASADQAITVSERRVAFHRVAVADLTIRAPFTGIVISKSAQAGEMISPVSAGGGFTRTGIGTIVDMDSLEVEVDVNESYINRIRVGQVVSITLNAYPEQHYEGSVITIIPTADRNKATIRVRVRIRHPDERVLPEMGVRVAFLSE